MNKTRDKQNRSKAKPKTAGHKDAFAGMSIPSKRLIYLSLIGIALTLLVLILDNIILDLAISSQLPLWVKIFSFITYFGEVAPFTVIVVIVSVILFFSRKATLRDGLVTFWLALLTSYIIGTIIKIIVARPRPFTAMHLAPLVEASGASFPSGHAIAAFTMLPFMIRYFPKGRLVWWIVAIAIAFSRLYLQVHYLSDVVAGAFIGYIIASLFIYLGEKYGW